MGATSSNLLRASPVRSARLWIGYLLIIEQGGAHRRLMNTCLMLPGSGSERKVLIPRTMRLCEKQRGSEEIIELTSTYSPSISEKGGKASTSEESLTAEERERLNARRALRSASVRVAPRLRQRTERAGLIICAVGGRILPHHD